MGYCFMVMFERQYKIGFQWARNRCWDVQQRHQLQLTGVEQGQQGDTLLPARSVPYYHHRGHNISVAVVLKAIFPPPLLVIIIFLERTIYFPKGIQESDGLFLRKDLKQTISFDTLVRLVCRNFLSHFSVYCHYYKSFCFYCEKYAADFRKLLDWTGFRGWLNRCESSIRSIVVVLESTYHNWRISHFLGDLKGNSRLSAPWKKMGRIKKCAGKKST